MLQSCFCLSIDILISQFDNICEYITNIWCETREQQRWKLNREATIAASAKSTLILVYSCHLWSVRPFLIHPYTKKVKLKVSVLSGSYLNIQKASTISHLQSFFYFIRHIQVMSEVQGKKGFSQVLLFFTFVFVCAGFQRPWMISLCARVHSPQLWDRTLCSVDWRLFLAFPHDSKVLLFLRMTRADCTIIYPVLQFFH